MANVPMADFEAGKLAGAEDLCPMDAFDMSMQEPDFRLGYIVGHSQSQSVRAARQEAAAWTAGELAYRYLVSIEALARILESELGFDGYLLNELRKSYADEAEGDDSAY